ncbi:hypothetical protein [Castellaniella sp. S9]|uniref:hypothetical protein n=1 Tax=Castellaniella sp. S9 TaxID=2993652 RepID=UPI0022B4C454|nr:hypothetical protein [Castellaniella sp. S9]
MTFNSTLKPGKPLQRNREKKGKGLAQRIAESLGRAIKHARGESGLLRSEAHRRNVAALGCLITGRPAQACHANFGKGMGLKVCDSLCFPLCPELHREHDQGGGMTRLERIKREWEYVDRTRALLIRRNQWPAEVEAAYQIAIVPLARVVHGEAAHA